VALLLLERGREGAGCCRSKQLWQLWQLRLPQVSGRVTVGVSLHGRRNKHKQEVYWEEEEEEEEEKEVEEVDFSQSGLLKRTALVAGAL